MKPALLLALALAFGGVLAVATPTAAACTPYSVCALQHDLACAEAADGPADKVACVDLM